MVLVLVEVVLVVLMLVVVVVMLVVMLVLVLVVRACACLYICTNVYLYIYIYTYYHVYPPRFCTPHTFPGLAGGSTDGPSGRVRIQYPLRFCAPLTHSLAPWGAPQKEGPNEWQGSCAVPGLFLHTTHTLLGPMGCSTEGSSDKARMRHPAQPKRGTYSVKDTILVLEYDGVLHQARFCLRSLAEVESVTPTTTPEEGEDKQQGK